MAWTDPPSYTNGQIVTQTDLHVGLRDNMRELWHEVAYVEFTSPVTATAGTHTFVSPLDVVSAGAVTYGAFPTIVEFYCPGSTFTNGAGHAGVGLSLWEAAEMGIMHAVFETSSTSHGSILVYRRFTPTAASHTYKIRIWGITAGSEAVVQAGPGTGTYMPGFIRVWQKGGA